MAQHKKCLARSSTQLPAQPPVVFKFVEDTPGQSDETVPAVLVLMLIGYTEGGIQVTAAAVERMSNS